MRHIYVTQMAELSLNFKKIFYKIIRLQMLNQKKMKNIVTKCKNYLETFCYFLLAFFKFILNQTFLKFLYLRRTQK